MTGARARWRGLRHRLSPPYHELLEREVGAAGSILDVGCGEASPLGRFRSRVHSVGVDAHPEAVAASRARGVHDEYVVADALSLVDRFEPRSFDAVVALDVVEHLEETDALRLLEQMEMIARKRVVVFTPNGFLPQGERGGNPWQVHRSGWSAGRLRALGYRVRGVHGVRGLRTEEARPRWRPERAWHLVSDLTQPLACRFPRLAFQLLATKELDAGGRR